jgi:hypothetical protein
MIGLWAAIVSTALDPGLSGCCGRGWDWFRGTTGMRLCRCCPARPVRGPGAARSLLAGLTLASASKMAAPFLIFGAFYVAGIVLIRRYVDPSRSGYGLEERVPSANLADPAHEGPHP